MSTDGPPNDPANQPPIEPPTEPMPSEPAPAPGGFAAPPPPNMPPPPGAPPTIPPMSAAPGAPPRGSRRQFLLGLLIGAIPLALALVGLGSLVNFTQASPLGYFLTAGGIGFVVGLVVAIILIIIEATRRIGLGMLTALLASPIIFFIGCLVALARPFGL